MRLPISADLNQLLKRDSYDSSSPSSFFLRWHGKFKKNTRKYSLKINLEKMKPSHYWTSWARDKLFGSTPIILRCRCSCGYEEIFGRITFLSEQVVAGVLLVWDVIS